jgi:hypothetical protein
MKKATLILFLLVGFSTAFGQIKLPSKVRTQKKAKPFLDSLKKLNSEAKKTDSIYNAAADTLVIKLTEKQAAVVFDAITSAEKGLSHSTSLTADEATNTTAIIGKIQEIIYKRYGAKWFPQTKTNTKQPPLK